MNLFNRNKTLALSSPAYCQLVLLIINLTLVKLTRTQFIESDDQILRLKSVPIKTPQLFHDGLLPGLEPGIGEHIEHLGRVVKLNTWFSPKSSIKASFSIYNRRKIMKNIKFAPYKHSSLGEFGAKYGPYEFDLDSILQSGFGFTKKTIVMIAGYYSEREEPWIKAARESWMEIDDVNVIVVDWSEYNRGMYFTAVANTPLVARQISIFLYYLAELSNKSLRDTDFLMNIHLIGHSLGAHIAGFVGRDLGGQVGRITGLDPAGPSFDTFNRTQRLDRRSAKLVDVIHTNNGRMRYAKAIPNLSVSQISFLNSMAGAISSMYSFEDDTAWFGIENHLGHIDYYANNGRVQPGCNDRNHICDHLRATLIYTGILDYERSLRKWTNDARILKSRRLLAFKADDYDDFMLGANFKEYCPMIVDSASHLSANVSQSFQPCSLPIDLVAPTRELIQELRDVYNINFTTRYDDGDDDLTKPIETPKYYFSTLDEDAHQIGDQYVMKIFTDYIFFDESCMLKIRFNFPNDLKPVEIELSSAANVRSSSSEPLAIPFVHTGGMETREKLAILLNQLHEDPDAQLESGQWEDLLPNTLNVSISDSKPMGVIDRFKSSIGGMLGRPSDRPTCTFGFFLIEIHSILGIGRNFAGIYGDTPQQDNGMPSVRVFNSSELVDYINQNINDVHGSLLTARGNPTNVGLRAIAVG